MALLGDRRKRSWRWLAGPAVVLLAAMAAIPVAFPFPPDLLDSSRHLSTTILDREGKVLFDALSVQGTRSAWMTAEEVPDAAIAAIVAAEDHRFFRHRGLDPVAIGRAAVVNVRVLGIVEGGSTITQQTAKLLLAGHPARYQNRIARKIHEAVIAVRLETMLSKREIAALYLNLAPFGNQYTGLRRASVGYFGIEPRFLTDAQMALLAAVPQSPTRFDPRKNNEGLIQRQRWILRRMVEAGTLAASSYRLAINERVAARDTSNEILAPHLVARLQHEARGTAELKLTIDAELQKSVRGILEAHRARLARHHAMNVAVVVLDNRSGEWLAWEGSGDYFDASHSGAIDGVLVARQPGSALKPFAYAAAFDRGRGAETVLADVESTFATEEEGIVYVPQNYDGVFRGPVRSRIALAGSLNVPAVRLVSEIGVPRFLGTLRSAGITTLDRSAGWYGLGAVLGGGEVTLAELVTAYAMLARGGVRVEPTLFAEGSPCAADSPYGCRAGRQGNLERVVSEEAAFLVTDILDDDDARSFVFGRGGSLELPFPAAAKTGTSQAYRDNWAIGYSPDVTVGVWVGNFDRAELRNSSGVTGAAPIFHDVMIAAQERFGGSTAFRRPATLSSARICLLSGMEPTSVCPAVGREWVRRGAGARCTWHRSITRSDGAGSVRTAVGVSWPDEVRAWASRNGRPEIAVTADRVRKTGEAAPLSIIHPADGAVYLLDPTLRSSYQSVALRASVAGGARELTWSVNGRRLASLPSHRPFDLPLRPGTMKIEVSDGRSRDAVSIRVK